jgi:aspartokinase/homoserine dehydrogenase 1
MTELFEASRDAGEVLRYVGRLHADGHATVGLERIGRDHPLASISLTDNVIQFATRRYCDNPLIVRGPGAGPDVTAAGVFADLLRLASYLGAAL